MEEERGRKRGPSRGEPWRARKRANLTKSLSDLPNEMLAKVLGWFSLERGAVLLSLRLVCQLWRNLIDAYLMRRSLLQLATHDLSTLTKIQVRWPAWKLHLDLSGCEALEDVQALGGLQSLNLSYCRALEDVSALGGVRRLDLSHCRALEDVSALGGVHSLNLSHCRALEDVSALGGVHSLNLSHCRRVQDVSALGGLHSLDLSFCDGVKDVQALGGLHSLRLSYCEGIRDVGYLARLHSLAGLNSLDLSSCWNVSDVSAGRPGAGRAALALLVRLLRVSDVRGLAGVHTLIV